MRRGEWNRCVRLMAAALSEENVRYEPDNHILLPSGVEIRSYGKPKISQSYQKVEKVDRGANYVAKNPIATFNVFLTGERTASAYLKLGEVKSDRREGEILNTLLRTY